jgi:hypothetical protein
MMKRAFLLFVLSTAVVLSVARLAQADHVQGHDQEARGWVQNLDARLTVLEGQPSLGGLSCAAGEVAKFDGTSWVCAPDDDTVGGLSCAAGEVAKFDGTSWVCAPDEDTVGGLSCAAGEVAKFDGASWVCAADEVGVTFLRTIVVSPVGPAETDNCNELLDALAGITDNSASNPYLIKLEPGIYDCGFNRVTMKPFVDIEGSGQETTVIRSDQQTVDGASNSELRFLTVEGDPIAIFFSSLTSFRLTHVTARASSGSLLVEGISGGGSATLTNVTTTGSNTGGGTGEGMRAAGSGVLTLSNVVAVGESASGTGTGVNIVNTLGTTLTATGSILRGDTNSLRVEPSNTANIVASQLDGTVVGSVGATLNCFAAFDGAFVALGLGC